MLAGKDSPEPVVLIDHLLTAGFATQAAKNGPTAFDIMRQTGHRSVQTVSRYVREAQISAMPPLGSWGSDFVCSKYLWRAEKGGVRP